MRYLINDRIITYECNNETSQGDEIILIEKGEDLTAGLSWTTEGFIVTKCLHEQYQDKVRRGSIDLIGSILKESGVEIPNDFELEKYHEIVRDQGEHLSIINRTKLLPVESFPIDIRLIEDAVSSICRKPLRAHNPFDNQEVFHFRIIRPQSGDNNPLHRDVWLEDYDDCINLYIPIAGSNALSSLIISPGSHHWPESRLWITSGGAMIGSAKFNVPAVVAIEGNYELIRPNPGRDEILIFSPYLIHGGAVNLDTEHTRVSIEMRLWKKR